MSIELRYVSGQDVKFRRRGDALHLDVELGDGTWIENVLVKRVFPLSTPNEYLSIQDREEKEIAILENFDQLEPESKQLVEAELDRRYFTPQIQKIVSLKQEAGMWRFAVETQRGESDFYVRNWRDSAYELVPNRWQIISVDGGRYEILDLDALDQRSQGLIEQLL